MRRGKDNDNENENVFLLALTENKSWHALTVPLARVEG